ncbi:MAG: hypothetical protein RPR97_07265 [Colwellia sp.]
MESTYNEATSIRSSVRLGIDPNSALSKVPWMTVLNQTKSFFVDGEPIVVSLTNISDFRIGIKEFIPGNSDRMVCDSLPPLSIGKDNPCIGVFNASSLFSSEMKLFYYISNGEGQQFELQLTYTWKSKTTGTITLKLSSDKLKEFLMMNSHIFNRIVLEDSALNFDVAAIAFGPTIDIVVTGLN